MNIEKFLSEHGVSPLPPMLDLKFGVADSVRADTDGVLHGMRCSPESGTSGWFIWAGDYSDAEDFFKPLHGQHLLNDRPEIEPLLSLPPGCRFLYHANHLDVWFDERLLES